MCPSDNCPFEQAGGHAMFTEIRTHLAKLTAIEDGLAHRIKALDVRLETLNGRVYNQNRLIGWVVGLATGISATVSLVITWLKGG